MRRFALGLLCALLLLSQCCGCFSARRAERAAVADFERGNFVSAAEALADSESTRKGAERRQLNRATALLAAGNPATAEALFRETRRSLEHLSTKDVREEAGVLIVDDKVRAWSGREFELRMLDSLLTVSSMLSNGGDAWAYAQQGMQQLREDAADVRSESGVDDDSAGSPPVSAAVTSATNDEFSAPRRSAAAPRLQLPDRFAADAVSALLYAAVHSERPTSVDEADRALALLAAERPVFAGASRALNPVTQVSATTTIEGDAPVVDFQLGVQTPQEHGAVIVLAMIGRVTEWDSVRAEPTSTALLIADRILSATGKHSLPPTIAPVRIARPRFSVSQAAVQPLITVRGSEEEVPFRTLADLNSAAQDSFEVTRDRMIAAAIARRVIKKAAVYAAKEQLNTQRGSLGDLAVNVAGIAWEATERADTRHWQLLPDRIDAAVLTLPEGSHTLSVNLRPSGGSGADVPVFVENGRNTLVVVWCPDGQQISAVQTRESVQSGSGSVALTAERKKAVR